MQPLIHGNFEGAEQRKREGKPTLLDPDLFKSAGYRLRISGQLLQQISLGAMMIELPIYLQIVLEYNALQAGLSLAPLSLTMFAVALLAWQESLARKPGNRRPASIIRLGFALLTLGMVVLRPIVPRARSGWYLVIPLMLAGSGLGVRRDTGLRSAPSAGAILGGGDKPSLREEEEAAASSGLRPVDPRGHDGRPPRRKRG